jgi:ribosomal protein L12E/L44/L45/RPP1/RPP2
MKYNLSDYLLLNKNGKPIDSSQITKLLNKAFGKNVSIDLLRHSFISSKYENILALKEILDTAEQMGHSVLQSLQYIKRESKENSKNSDTEIEIKEAEILKSKTKSKLKTKKMIKM